MKISGADRPHKAGPSPGLWKRTRVRMYTWPWQVSTMGITSKAVARATTMDFTLKAVARATRWAMLSTLHAANSVGLEQTRQRIFPLRWHLCQLIRKLWQVLI